MNKLHNHFSEMLLFQFNLSGIFACLVSQTFLKESFLKKDLSN